MNDSLDAPPVSDDAAVADICARLRAAGIAALDTEFERVRTFHAQLALLQLGISDRQHWLIDPLGREDWTPLGELLADPDTVKILHSCEEDVELLARVTGSHPQNVFDTQVAAAFAGYGFSPGYNRLVEAVLGVQLAKGQQRSDWMQRPLSAAQLRYARADVEYLPALYEHLLERVGGRGYSAWFEAECREIIDRRLSDNAGFEVANFRNARALTPQQRAAVQRLGEWREQTARERDLPRNWLFRDEDLLAIVEAWPATVDELRRVPGMRRARAMRDAGELLGMLAGARDLPDADCPMLPDLPPPGQIRRIVQALMEKTRQRARDLDLPPELLAPRKRVQALVLRGYPRGPWTLPPSLRGWREEAVGPLLLAAVEELCAEEDP